MASQGPPTDRGSFRVAIICALSREADAVSLLFEHFWDKERGPYGRADGDTNHYITGRIGEHDIVLAVLPGMGTNSAAAATASLRSSYTGLKLALLVGICGGVPRVANFDAYLGDVVVSEAIIPYDYGRQYPSHLAVKNTVEDSLGRANKDIRSLLAVFETELVREWLQDDASKNLKDLQEAGKKKRRQANYQYPGTKEDKLYPAAYAHRHRKWCSVCADDPDAFCESASKASCTETGCDSAHLTVRERPEEVVPGGHFRPGVYIGRIGSGNTVMKSGGDRDQIAAQHNLIAFEMEGAGAWDEVPCIVVKGICDYADSHKNKAWQDFAAATAAAVAKAILGRYVVHDGDNKLCTRVESTTDDSPDKARETYYYIPLPNKRFTGRTTVLNALEDNFFGQEQTQRMALVGLGGIGKTQIALHFAYQVKEKRPEYSIFWVPVLSNETAEGAYVGIAKKLGLQKSSEDDDVKDLVYQHLSSDKAGKWLLIVDNADDEELVLGSADKSGLEEYLPQSENGMILLTTRSRQVAGKFAQYDDVIDVEQMDKKEAMNLLRITLNQKQLLEDEAVTVELLTYLTFLPLAITQAVAYLNEMQAPIQTYLSLLQDVESDARVLEEEFGDNTRYRGSQNAVGTTWIVSFRRIQKSNQLAIKLLSFMSCIEPKAIPQSILPNDAKPYDLERAVGTLCSYSFLVRRGQSNVFDMHSLVHVAMRGWLRKQELENQVTYDAICHLAARFPTRSDAHHDVKREYLPHAIRLLSRNSRQNVDETYRLFGKVGGSFEIDRRFKEAVKCFEEVCLWKQGLLPENDNDRLESEHTLASAYLDDRRIEDAIEKLEHVVAVRKEKLDKKDHSRLSSEHKLARAYLDNRRIKDAIEILEHVVAVQEETLDKKDHNRLSSEHLLARAYLDDRRIKDAIKIFEHVLVVRKKTLNAKDHDRLISEQTLATAYLNDRRINDAIEMLEHVVAVRKETLDEKDHSRLSSEHELARAYLDNRRIKDAIEILEHVVAVREETLDKKDYPRLNSEHSLARAYLDDRRIKDAIKIFEHVLVVRKKTLNAKDHDRLISEHALATAYLNDRRINDAIEMLEHVVAVWKETLDEKDHDRLSSEHELARAYLDNRRIKDAIEILEHVVAVRKETLDEKDHSRLASEYALASAYLNDGRIEDAIKILEHVVAIEAEILAESDHSRQLAVNLLQDCFERLKVASGDNDV
ncbi:kinesin light chain [Fusarium mexicanum]|uniref:Kinesin light chain n=1 Tax=Fusarium mexicanum TaxID=751941 RepID=A0A8H5I5X6_9HYPO|nr:kinesin light chain [Fusarium mexicanum]